MSSILNDVKHKIGPSEEYDYYDLDIIDAINEAFAVLNQHGAGTENFRISDSTAKWDDFTTDPLIQNLVQTYVYQKVRVIFDPPNSSFVLSNIMDQLREKEYRIATEVNYKEGVQNGN